MPKPVNLHMHKKLKQLKSAFLVTLYNASCDKFCRF